MGSLARPVRIRAALAAFQTKEAPASAGVASFIDNLRLHSNAMRNIRSQLPASPKAVAVQLDQEAVRQTAIGRVVLDIG